MIQADIFYTAKCDRCHRTFNEVHGGLEVTHFPDAGEAKDYAISNDWFEYEGKHYCPDCLIETEEEPIVKPDYPRWVWDIKAILESTIAFCKTFVYIDDMDDAICFTGYLKGKDIPNQCLIETIIDTEVVKMNAAHIEIIECERNGTPCRNNRFKLILPLEGNKKSHYYGYTF